MLHTLQSPKDLSQLSLSELESLAQEIREFLIEKVSRTGGHLGPNLGVVELTLAMHRVFDSPEDPIVFDTGHQSYIHKILTGRVEGFDQLRQGGGLAGYPSREESVHDVVENSHASTSLSWADGISRGFSLTGQSERCVVAVIGDGALTGGMAWEALNNIAVAKNQRLVIVLNDNERSYSPTIGGIAHSLAKLRSKDSEHQGIFSTLGIAYLGPINGHDLGKLEETLKEAKALTHPVVVHVVTEKGRGHKPALDDDAERFHAVGIVDSLTGKSISPSAKTWTSVFGKELALLGQERQDIVAITAAMQGPTGLNEFQKLFPERTIDVGIAEQHAVTSAAGLSFAGLHPVVALYSTFLNRAYDQLLLDVALHKAGVTFVLDRAGITGDDGASHNGVWDMALTGIVPNLRIAVPRDERRLKELLRQAICIEDAPTVVRFPKGALAHQIEAIRNLDGFDILCEREKRSVLILAVGPFAAMALEIAETLTNIPITVVDPLWVKPLSAQLLAYCASFSMLVVIEDGIEHGGIATTISEELRANHSSIQIISCGVPLKFLDHAKRSTILEENNLSAEAIGSIYAGRDATPFSWKRFPHTDSLTPARSR
ncbi:MAG: 1-deoxy-D-xylulose-5-phosphate synthase [Actinobacteria bacterium]|nr:1-deoxy-D-xylulose-5-phosphate synthase [Actinomycetota bacterium]